MRGKHVIFNIERTLTDDMIDLRTVDYFHNEFAVDEVVDKFDSDALFATLSIDEELIATARITDTSVISIFEEWSKGKDITPKGNNCYEISRAVIKREWRNRAMYHVLIIFILKYLKENNAQAVNCVSVKESNLHKFIQNMGAVKCGVPYICYDVPCLPMTTQAYSLDLTDTGSLHLYQKEKSRIMQTITQRGYQITSKI